MAKIGILLPHKETASILEDVLGEKNFYQISKEIVYKEIVRTVNTVAEARKAVDQGAEILVARGYQALLIKKYTSIPLAEIRLHAQELGSLLKRAKIITGKEHPCVALVVFENMIQDLSDLEELFEVTIHPYFLKDPEDIYERLSSIGQEKNPPDMVIGGDTVCQEAENMGFLSLRYGYSHVSIREALYEAERMSYALDSEKQNSAQLETLLGTTFNGIIKINERGNITVINKIVENLIGKDAESVKGLDLAGVFPYFNMDSIQSILSGEIDQYTTTVYLRRQPWILMAAPIQYNEKVTGAILSLAKTEAPARQELSANKEMILGGHTAGATFDALRTRNAFMQNQINLAKKYALSDHPVLLYGEEGTEYITLAEAIHNNSRRKPGPFIRVNAAALDPQLQEKVLFGQSDDDPDGRIDDKSAVFRANHGTLFLQGAEHLSLGAQHKMARILFAQASGKMDYLGTAHLSVRFIFSAKENLGIFVQKETFSRELFYLIQGLTLHVPPLSNRKEDLEALFLESFSNCAKRYGKYLVLTEGAKELVKNLPWEGNRFQIIAFCERLVLETDKRSIDEIFIRNLYETLYPLIREESGTPTVVVYRTPEADEIQALLTQFNGSRSRVAKEMGISTTTLWRKMKKYGIRENY